MARLKDISKSIENGQKKAAVCAACHGVNGNSVNPEWPSLANQSVKYMVEQLQHFKSGVRKNVLMSSQATNLSTEDMIDLSNYCNHQKPNIKAASANEDVLILGETIYRGGIINREENELYYFYYYEPKSDYDYKLKFDYSGKEY